MSLPTPPDDRGYSRWCTACGAQIDHCNMYGMGTCPKCGFEDRPTQSQNTERAREWRKEHPVSEETFRRILGDAEASNLIDAIQSGQWDGYLTDITEAVRQRRQGRQDALLAQVHEVFGPNYSITATK